MSKKKSISDAQLLVVSKRSSKSGWVEKEANKRKILQKRFLLLGGTHIIYFHEKPTDKTLLGLSRCDIPLIAILSVQPVEGASTTFRIKLSERDFIFKSQNIAECGNWISAILESKATVENDLKIKSGIKLVIQPNVGFVLKSKKLKIEGKVFVNVFWSDDVSTFMSSPLKTILRTDNDVEQKLEVYSIVLPTHLIESCRTDTAAKAMISKKVLAHIDSHYQVGMDTENYTTPKIMKGFIE